MGETTNGRHACALVSVAFQATSTTPTLLPPALREHYVKENLGVGRKFLGEQTHTVVRMLGILITRGSITGAACLSSPRPKAARLSP